MVKFAQSIEAEVKGLIEECDCGMLFATFANETIIRMFTRVVVTNNTPCMKRGRKIRYGDAVTRKINL